MIYCIYAPACSSPSPPWHGLMSVFGESSTMPLAYRSCRVNTVCTDSSLRDCDGSRPRLRLVSVKSTLRLGTSACYSARISLEDGRLTLAEMMMAANAGKKINPFRRIKPNMDGKYPSDGTIKYEWGWHGFIGPCHRGVLTRDTRAYISIRFTMQFEFSEMF